VSEQRPNLEQIRSAHRPTQVHTLFVGESPPANGAFFYLGNSNLSRYTADAFASVYGPYPSSNAFLADFRRRGCYLVDLCPDPVNHVAKPARRAAHRAGIPGLAAARRELRPGRIVVVMKAIEDAVLAAREKAELTAVPLAALPFPAQSNQLRYVEGLTAGAPAQAGRAPG
jgi:hypothetical protein